MRIRFSCTQCGQRLSVEENRAGTKAKCPKCKAPIVVPGAADDRAAEQGPTSAAPPTEATVAAGVARGDSDAAGEGDVFAEFVVYDDEPGLDGEPGPPAERRAATYRGDYVPVPQTIVLLQGILLGLVAIVAFVLGMLFARPAADHTTRDEPRQPRRLAGVVRYTFSGERRPDDGAVVIALPADVRPNAAERMPVGGLRPEDPPPLDTDAGLAAIRGLGGAYVRADVAGRYELQLPDGGAYYVLVVSRNSFRSDSETLDGGHLAELGRYFRPATELLGRRRYRWLREDVHTDRTHDVLF